MTETREQLIARQRVAQRERDRLGAELRNAAIEHRRTGKKHKLKWLQDANRKVADLVALDRELSDRIKSMPTPKQREIGRRYNSLCRAIKHEMGEAALASFLAEADRLMEADIAPRRWRGIPDEHNAFEQAVEQWGKRGNRGRIGGINKSPFPLFELPGYFQKLTVQKLAGCWVGCITEACLDNDFTVGDMARALVVVAEKLHGLKFEVVGDPPQIQLKEDKPCSRDSAKVKSCTSEPGTSDKHFLRLAKKNGRASKR